MPCNAWQECSDAPSSLTVYQRGPRGPCLNPGCHHPGPPRVPTFRAKAPERRDLLSRRIRLGSSPLQSIQTVRASSRAKDKSPKVTCPPLQSHAQHPSPLLVMSSTPLLRSCLHCACMHARLNMLHASNRPPRGHAYMCAISVRPSEARARPELRCRVDRQAPRVVTRPTAGPTAQHQEDNESRVKCRGQLSLD